MKQVGQQMNAMQMTDAEAAHEYRLKQAEALIAIHKRQVEGIVAIARREFASLSNDALANETIRGIVETVSRDDFVSRVYADDKAAIETLASLLNVFEDPAGPSRN